MDKFVLLLLVVTLSLTKAQVSFQNSNNDNGQGLQEEQKLQQILDKYGRSVGDECDCVQFRDCQWATEALVISSGLAKTSTARTGLVVLLKHRSCNSEYGTIRCCESQKSVEGNSNPNTMIDDEATQFGVTGNRRLNHNNSVGQFLNMSNICL